MYNSTAPAGGYYPNDIHCFDESSCAFALDGSLSQPSQILTTTDGGATWAANWSAGSDLPGPYCEASILGAPSQGKLYVVGPSGPGRGNLSVHISSDGGLTWPVSHVLYPKGAAYSDASWTTAGGEGDKEAPALAFFFERDNYNTAAFGKLPGV